MITKSLEQWHSERERLLREMEMTHDEFVEHYRQAACPCCVRPSWDERYDNWDAVENIDYLLSEGPYADGFEWGGEK